MNRDEITALHRVFEADQLDADLFCTSRSDVRVITNQVSTKASETLCHKRADAAKTNYADGLFIEFNTSELRALPLARFERSVGIRNKPCQSKKVPDRELGRRNNV